MKKVWVVSTSVFLVMLMAVAHAAAATKITVFHRSSNDQENQFLYRAIELFQAKHPGISVEPVPSGTGGGGDYVEKLTVLRASGIVPDVFHSSADKLGYMMRGWTLDITPFFERDKNELLVGDFLPGMLDTFRRGTRLYGLPVSVTGQAIFWNRDLVAEAGLPDIPSDWDSSRWTWTEFVEYCRKLVKALPDDTLQQAAIQQFGEHKLPDPAWIFGGDWFAAEAYETNVATASTLDRPENIESWRAMQDLYLRGWVADAPGSGIDAWSGFVAGQIAMDWIGWWKVGTYKSANPSFAYAMAPLPKVQTRQHTLWTDTWFISAETTQPAESWEFVKSIATTETQQLKQQYGATGPTRRSALGAYVSTMITGTGMNARDVTLMLNGAVAHGRRSLEQSVYGAAELDKRMADWLAPMVRGQEGVETTIARIKPLVDAIVAEYAQKARESK